MKYVFIIAIILSSNLSANTKSLLQEVNPQWENYKETYNPKYNYSPQSEKELVKLHLLNAIDFLSERTESLDLSPKQLQSRNKNLRILTEYTEREIFPINNIQPERTPVFVDHLGTHCAVGYLQKQDKESELINLVKSSNNQIKILDIKSLDFNNWQAESGFTMAELALIQPNYGEEYSYSMSEKTIDEDAIINGTLFISGTQIDQHYYFVYGDIKSIDGIHVDNIAVYNHGNWKNFGNGISGEIKGMIQYNTGSLNRIFACGNDILPTGFKNDIAVYSKDNGWMSVGILTNGIVHQMTKKGNKIYAVGEFTQVNGIETHNIFSFDSKTYEIHGFGKQFQKGITKLSESTEVELCLLYKGSIWMLVDNKFEPIQIQDIGNTKFIDFEIQNHTNFWAISDSNNLVQIDGVDGYYLKSFQNTKVKDIFNYTYFSRNLIFAVAINDDKTIITSVDNYDPNSIPTHSFKVDSNYNHNLFIIGTWLPKYSDGKDVHLISHKKDKKTKYQELKLITSSLPLELQKFNVYTSGNSINYEIASDKLKNAKIELVNLQGEVLVSRKLNNYGENGQFQVNQKGLFLLNVNFDNKVVTKKVIVSN